MTLKLENFGAVLTGHLLCQLHPLSNRLNSRGTGRIRWTCIRTSHCLVHVPSQHTTVFAQSGTGSKNSLLCQSLHMREHFGIMTGTECRRLLPDCPIPTLCIIEAAVCSRLLTVERIRALRDPMLSCMKMQGEM